MPDRVSLCLKWLHQAQFAGYYLAAEQGFYRAEDLEVEICPAEPDVDPEHLVASGGAAFA
jgi:NitT/TauT family transport system substrate-binding protein